MILETAIGDAYAVAWEFVPADKQPAHTWDGYKKRPKTGERETSPAGAYTDDTLRTIANARVIIAGEALNPLAYVREIKRVFRQDRRLGWSRNFQAFLESQLDEPDEVWLRVLKGRNTNGALMGAPVMGCLPSADEVVAASRVQALVTHDEEAADYASAVSLAAYALRTGKCSPMHLNDYVSHTLPEVGQALRSIGWISGRVDMSAKMTAAAIFQVLGQNGSLYDIMHDVIRLGGDTDSVAAATFGMASLAPQAFDLSLPTWAFRGLEGGDVRMLMRTDADLDAAMSVNLSKGISQTGI